ncbi:MAG: protein-disulfide reductase DsbD domain-containing protein, partial [Rhodomicrobium sp.]
MAIWQATSALGFILTVFGLGNGAAAQQLHRHHVTVDLISDQSAAAPGKTITVAVRERMEPGWHTYWENPGDSGEPTHIEWNLPDGVTAGPVLWPLPHT